MKKVTFIVLLLLVGLFLATGNARADQVTIAMDSLLDWGTVYNFDGTTWTPTAATNPLGQPTTQTFVNGTSSPVYSNTQNDSYGILNVTKIFDMTNSSYLYNEVTSGSQILVVFQGFSDVAIDGTLSGSTIYSQNGSIALYEVPAGTYDPLTSLTAAQFNTYVGSLGTPVLTLTPQTIVDPDTGVAYTLENNFNFTTLSGTGFGMLLDVTGGSWADTFDTNLEPNGSDVLFNFTSYPAMYDNAGNPTTYRGWVVTGVANAQGNVVPEPASMTLLGLGLFGVARLRRRG